MMVMINSESSELKQMYGKTHLQTHIFPKKSMFKCSVVPALALDR